MTPSEAPPAPGGEDWIPATLREHLEKTFQLEREIGRGGMATVWLARRRSDGAQVAIKVLQPSLARALGVHRFLREIRIAANTRSPHLVPLEESGEVEGLPYYVMPYVEGESLRQRLLRERQLPVEEAVRIGRAVAEGLAALHRDGIVHRDIKPENVLLHDSDVLVADFGIARALTASAAEEITSTGIVLGTPAYMSPEQAAGDVVDARCDQYAWGCIQYEMLAGVAPFHGASSQAVMARHMHETPPSLRVVRTAVPAALEAVVLRAMGKAPADRFDSADAIVRALDQLDLTDLRDPAVTARAARRRRRWIAAAGILAVLAGIYTLLTRPAPLDAGRVVIFPFTDLAPGHEQDAEQVTILVGSALERIEPTRWIDGWSMLTAAERASRSGLAPGQGARLSKAKHARYYIDGSIVRQPALLRVVVTLHDLQQRSDTSVHADGPPTAAAADLGLNAIIGLLPRLTGLEKVIDVSSLQGRHPVAVSNWLRGEREYRASRIRPALEYLYRAVADDELLAPAALRGATAAMWLNRPDTALALVATALRHEAALAPRQVSFARALRFVLLGKADSAILALRQVLALDDRWADAWMLAGEVDLHLLPAISRDSQELQSLPPPTDWPLEARAEAAFKRSLALDPSYAPPLTHLAEIAARRGDLAEFRRYADQLRAAHADSLPLAVIALIRECLTRTARRLDWTREARQHRLVVYRLGITLQAASDPGARGCARSAFTAVLASDPAENDEDWGSLLSLHAMLAAQGDSASALALADSAVASGLTAPLGLYVLDAMAGLGPGRRADAFIAQLDAAMDSRGAPSLWLLALWGARTADTARLVRVNTILATRKAGSSATRLDSLIAGAAAAYLSLARRDSAGALRRFAALTPTATIGDLQGSLWEPLAPERLQYARLLLARGDAAAAHRVASVFDQPGILIYPLFLRESLTLRASAARALEDRRLEALAQARLRALAAETH